MCICVRACLQLVCSWYAPNSAAHSKIWLTELTRPIALPQSVQLLQPLFHLVAPTLLSSCHESTQTHMLLHQNRNAHTRTHSWMRERQSKRDRKRGWERGEKNKKVPIKLLRQFCQQASGGWRRWVFACLCVCVLDKGVEGVWLELRSLTFALSVLYLCKFRNNSLPWGVNNLLRRLAIIKSLSLFIVVCWQFPIICCIVAPCTHLYIDF